LFYYFIDLQEGQDKIFNSKISGQINLVMSALTPFLDIPAARFAQFHKKQKLLIDQIIGPKLV